MMTTEGDVSSFCGASALGSSPLFPLLFPHAARPPLHVHREPQASDQTDCCLPRHRQAVRLQCFYHWRVVDVFHRWFPPLVSTDVFALLYRGSARRCWSLLDRCYFRFLWMRDKGSSKVVSSFCDVSALGSSPLFPHPACSLPHAHRDSQPTGQIAGGEVTVVLTLERR